MPKSKVVVPHDFIRSKSDAELGALLREYLNEADHGGWDGYSRSDLTGIRRCLADMVIYDQNK